MQKPTGKYKSHDMNQISEPCKKNWLTPWQHNKEFDRVFFCRSLNLWAGGWPKSNSYFNPIRFHSFWEEKNIHNLELIYIGMLLETNL